MLRAVNVTKRLTLAERVEWAGTSEARRKGLLGRSHLEPGEAIYIVPTQWLHTFRMRFAIDIAFLDRDGKILAIHHGLKPNRFSRIVLRADGALEMAAGHLRDTGTTVGDVIEFPEG